MKKFILFVVLFIIIAYGFDLYSKKTAEAPVVNQEQENTQEQTNIVNTENTKTINLETDLPSSPTTGEAISTEPVVLIVGGDRDEHGCIGSAGYSWCESKQECLRPWEPEWDESCGTI